MNQPLIHRVLELLDDKIAKARENNEFLSASDLQIDYADYQLDKNTPLVW